MHSGDVSGITFRFIWIWFCSGFFFSLSSFFSLPHGVHLWLQQCFYLSMALLPNMLSFSNLSNILIEANAFPISNFRVFWPLFFLLPFGFFGFPRVNMMFTTSCIIKIEMEFRSEGHVDSTKIIHNITDIDRPNHRTPNSTFHYLNIRWVGIYTTRRPNVPHYSIVHFIFCLLVQVVYVCMYECTLYGIRSNHESSSIRDKKKRWFVTHKYSLSVMFTQKNSLVIHLNESIYFDFPFFQRHPLLMHNSSKLVI